MWMIIVIWIQHDPATEVKIHWAPVDPDGELRIKLLGPSIQRFPLQNKSKRQAQKLGQSQRTQKRFAWNWAYMYNIYIFTCIISIHAYMIIHVYIPMSQNCIFNGEKMCKDIGCWGYLFFDKDTWSPALCWLLKPGSLKSEIAIRLLLRQATIILQYIYIL